MTIILSPPGSAKCNERRRDNGQARPALLKESKLVHPGDVRHQRRRTLRGPRLALESAQERQSLVTLLTIN